MSAKILILILILLILLSWNCNKESFSVKSHFIVNGAAPGTADTSTYKLTNNIVKKGNSYKSSDFQSNGFLNMYTQFGSHYFPKNLYPSDNQIPVLILESYRSCPTLYNLYRNLIRYDSQGKNQTETVEGARIRSLIQSTFFNINQPAPMDYQILEMYALDKNNVSQEQPRLNLSLDKKDINNSKIVSLINDPIFQAKFGKNYQITDGNNTTVDKYDSDLNTKGMYFTLHKEFKITFTLKLLGGKDLSSAIPSGDYTVIYNLINFINNDDSASIFDFHFKFSGSEFTMSSSPDQKITDGYSEGITVGQTINIVIQSGSGISKDKIIAGFAETINPNTTATYHELNSLHTVEKSECQVFFSKGTSPANSGWKDVSPPQNLFKISNFTYNNLTEPKITYKSPNYNYNEKNSTFGVKEDYTLPDIMRFMDFGFTTLCWGALHINLLKPLDNHYYGFPCQNEKCNTSSTANYYFYLLPVRIRQMCFEEGKKYTRAKCNHCASNIIVYFDILPSKFKNLNVLNNTDTTALHNLI